jgi:hypothetical protein
MTDQLDLFGKSTRHDGRISIDGERLKQEGINAAINHADFKIDGWQEKAWELFLRFPIYQKFMVEDLRSFSYKRGLPNPPSERAWGAIIIRAKKDRIVKHCGYASVKNPSAHRTPASVWMKVK